MLPTPESIPVMAGNYSNCLSAPRGRKSRMRNSWDCPFNINAVHSVSSVTGCTFHKVPRYQNISIFFVPVNNIICNLIFLKKSSWKALSEHLNQKFWKFTFSTLADTLNYFPYKTSLHNLYVPNFENQNKNGSLKLPRFCASLFYVLTSLWCNPQYKQIIVQKVLL